MGVLILAFVLAVAALVPIGRLGPLGDLALAYARPENTFFVADPTGRIRSAELKLCGETRTLQQSNGDFSATVPITCEGSGEVRLYFADGQKGSCVVGYVTPGAEQHFSFVVRGNECI